MGFKIAEIREILGEAYTDDVGKKLVTLHRSVVDPLLDDLQAQLAGIELAEGQVKVPVAP